VRIAAFFRALAAWGARNVHCPRGSRADNKAGKQVPFNKDDRGIRIRLAAGMKGKKKGEKRSSIWW